MRVIFCGSRTWGGWDTRTQLYADPIEVAAVYKAVYELPPNSVVIHGAARGADTLAQNAAAQYHIPCEGYPANWSLYGKAAGPIRNRQMLTEGHPDRVVFFSRDLRSSRGTRDMVGVALAAGVPVFDGLNGIQFEGFDDEDLVWTI